MWTSIGSGRALNAKEFNINKYLHQFQMPILPWCKVENSMRAGAHPFSEITSISKRNTTCDNPGLLLHLCSHETCTRYHDLIGWSNLSTNQLHFIRNQKANILNMFPLLPSSRKNIPLVNKKPSIQASSIHGNKAYLSRSANHNISTFLQQPQISACFSRQRHNILPALQSSKFGFPLCYP